LKSAADLATGRGGANRPAKISTTPLPDRLRDWSLKRFLDKIKGHRLRTAENGINQIEFGQAAKKRQNHRLYREIVTSEVSASPMIEEMRSRNFHRHPVKFRPRNNQVVLHPALAFAGRASSTGILVCGSIAMERGALKMGLPRE